MSEFRALSDVPPTWEWELPDPPVDLDDPYPDWKDQPYFVEGGVSVSRWRNPLLLPAGMEFTIEEITPRSPWSCLHCGGDNDPDTWKCIHCNAPRKRVTRREQSVWQPSTPVARDSAGHFTTLSTKPPPPWWVVIGLFLLGLGVLWIIPGVIGMLLAPGPIPLSLVFVSFVCYYTVRRVVPRARARYNWGED